MSKGHGFLVWIVTTLGTALWVSGMWKMTVGHQGFGDAAGALFTLGMSLHVVAIGIVIKES